MLVEQFFFWKLLLLFQDYIDTHQHAFVSLKSFAIFQISPHLSGIHCDQKEIHTELWTLLLTNDSSATAFFFHWLLNDLDDGFLPFFVMLSVKWWRSLWSICQEILDFWNFRAEGEKLPDFAKCTNWYHVFHDDKLWTQNKIDGFVVFV